MSSIKTAIGLMSGTSMDGIDAALICTDGEEFLDVKAHTNLVYNANFKQILKTALEEGKLINDRNERPHNLKSIEHQLTQKHIEAVKMLLTKADITSSEVDVIGFHGQTILHKPQQALTVQLGDGLYLANQTGIDVVYDMRANDMKYGGQGAPLVPIYHHALIHKVIKENQGTLNFPICFINIGGISNLTYIDKNNDLIAFDCGPGNVLIDQWMKLKTGLEFDKAGQCGLKGHIDKEIVELYKQHPFFKQENSGSLDWRDFKPLNADILTNDGAATLAYITAFGIVHSFRHLPNLPRTLIVSGGGAQNLTIMKFLTEFALNYKAITTTSNQLGMNSDFIEAEAWAYLAVRSLYNLPLTFPSTTSCQFPVSGGVLARYEN